MSDTFLHEDTYLGRYKYQFADIKSLELRFDRVVFADDHFILFCEGKLIASVASSELSDRTYSKLRSFADWNDNGRD